MFHSLYTIVVGETDRRILIVDSGTSIHIQSPSVNEQYDVGANDAKYKISQLTSTPSTHAQLVWRNLANVNGNKRAAQLNGVIVFSIEYNRATNTDTYSNGKNDKLLRVHYD